MATYRLYVRLIVLPPRLLHSFGAPFTVTYALWHDDPTRSDSMLWAHQEGHGGANAPDTVRTLTVATADRYLARTQSASWKLMPSQSCVVPGPFTRSPFTLPHTFAVLHDSL